MAVASALLLAPGVPVAAAGRCSYHLHAINGQSCSFVGSVAASDSSTYNRCAVRPSAPCRRRLCSVHSRQEWLHKVRRQVPTVSAARAAVYGTGGCPCAAAGNRRYSLLSCQAGGPASHHGMTASPHGMPTEACLQAVWGMVAGQGRMMWRTSTSYAIYMPVAPVVTVPGCSLCHSSARRRLTPARSPARCLHGTDRCVVCHSAPLGTSPGELYPAYGLTKKGTCVECQPQGEVLPAKGKGLALEQNAPIA